MGKNKLISYRTKTDITKIDISVLDAEITFTSTERPELVIEYSKSLSPDIQETDGILKFTKEKRRLFSFRAPKITVMIPGYCVPALSLKMHNGKAVLGGIIFGDVQINGGDIRTEISGCCFENLDVKAKELNATADDITVKNLANAAADGGRIGIDNSFCKKTECRMKKGNIGVSCSQCEYTVLDTGNGTVAANMVGNEKDYTIELEGASVIGKENQSESGKSFRARSATGSVVVDFSSPDSGKTGQKSEEKEELTV